MIRLRLGKIENHGIRSELTLQAEVGESEYRTSDSAQDEISQRGRPNVALHEKHREPDENRNRDRKSPNLARVPRGRDPLAQQSCKNHAGAENEGDRCNRGSHNDPHETPDSAVLLLLLFCHRMMCVGVGV
jgi:hypothetical protein